jgi:hypothetical protein
VSVKRADILTSALKYIGVRWRIRGRDPTQGLDCVGLLANVAWDNGYSFTDSLAYDPKNPDVAQYRALVIGQTDPGAINCIRTGSILLLKQALFPWHTGIAVMEKDGPPRLIHASIKDRQVVMVPLDTQYKQIVNVREFPGVL